MRMHNDDAPFTEQCADADAEKAESPLPSLK